MLRTTIPTFDDGGNDERSYGFGTMMKVRVRNPIITNEEEST